MQYQILCPHCQKPYQFPDAALGQHIRCPYCRNNAVVPAPASRGTVGPGARTLAEPPAAPPPLPPQLSSTPAAKIRKLPLLLGGLAALALLVLVLGGVLAFAFIHRRGPDTKLADATVDAKPVAEKAGDKSEVKQEGTDAKPVGTGAGNEDEAKQERDTDDATDGPPLLLQVHSLDRVFADVRILGAEMKKSKEVDQLFQVLKASFGEEGLPGIDSRRPWVAYLQIDADADLGRPVGLVPIRDEDGFLRLLHGLQCSTTKNADGVYVVEHAKLTRKVGFRFANHHAYVTLDNFDALKEQNLVDPSKVFVRNEEADILATFRIDRLPKELRSQAIARLQQAGPAMMAALPDASDVQRAYAAKVAELLTEADTQLMEGGRDLSLRLSIDANARRLDALLQLAGRKGSRLARNLASVQDTASMFGDPTTGQLAFRSRLRFHLPEALSKVLGSLAHEATDKILKDVKDPKEREEGEHFLRALEPTIASGDVDVAVMMRSQGEGKPLLSVAGLKVANGLELEKVFRRLVQTLPEEDRKLFHFDVAKAAGANIHSWSAQRVLPPEARQVLGANPFYYAFRRDAILVTPGANGQELIRQALENRSVKAPLALLELNVKHLLEIMPAGQPGTEEAKKVFTDANPGIVRLELGGKSGRLQLEFHLDLALVRLMAEMGLVKVEPRIEMKPR